VEVIFDEEVDALTELTRGNVGVLVGHALSDLKQRIHDQEQYAEASLEIARLTVAMAGDSASETASARTTDAKSRLLILADWDDGDITGEIVGEGTAGSASASGTALESLGDYHVFTRSYDKQVVGSDLYRADVLRDLRVDLDTQVKAQSVSAFRLARRLQQLFTVPTPEGWDDNHELGVLDSKRLAQIVSMPGNPNVYRQPADRPQADAAVTFLVDTSGSMKVQRYEAIAVLLDTYSRALDLAGVTTEILGFTTGAWSGGRPVKEFRAGPSADGPGRLNEILHIVYKDAEQPWRRARGSIAAMMRTLHYREGIDGEALIWAYRRLRARPERRKVLVMISDGAPMDAATTKANRAGFLADHLAGVSWSIAQDPAVELAAIGIDLGMDDFYPHTVQLDLTGTLTLATYQVLEELLTRRSPR
jgi:cobaltochelatase CobT